MSVTIKPFFDTLAEAYQRVHCIIHAYCLRNHYHVLLEAPDANLSRTMRHINGVYTQRHNRLKHTDGPLFEVGIIKVKVTLISICALFSFI